MLKSSLGIIAKKMFTTYGFIQFRTLLYVQRSLYSNQGGFLNFTGPLAAGSTKESYWENGWYNNSIRKATITSIEVEYMDGTSDSFKGNEIKYKAMDGCYVATVVFGSYVCPEFCTLRLFRDNILSSNVFCRLFIKFYSAVSPTLIKFYGKCSWFKKLFMPPLDSLVKKLNADGVENKPYND